jgi:dihydroorotase
VTAPLLIHGGRVVDPSQDLDGRFDVMLEDGAVARIDGRIAKSKGLELLDATGLVVTPGLIDMHVHLREPGYEYKETVATGAAAAVAGGFSAVACMANTNPVNDNGAVTEYIRERASEAGLARVYPIGAVSVGLNGTQLAEIGEMHAAGIVAISDDGRPVADAGLMRRALEYSALFHLPVIAHEEDPALVAGGVMNEGPTSFRLGLRGVPAAAEEVMVARDIALLERTGGKLHIAHLSTEGSVDLVRRAKQRGLPVSAEITPHHFTLTDEAVGCYDTNAKMNPPLRTAADVRALVEGLRDGVIDVIATDHAPHHRDEKEVEFERAAHGIIGLETALPLSLRLVREESVPLAVLLRALTVNPARILGIPCGGVSVGSLADIAVIDPEWTWNVVTENLRSRSRNTPFGGWDMRGAALATVVGGRVVWRATDRPGGNQHKRRSTKR